MVGSSPSKTSKTATMNDSSVINTGTSPRLSDVSKLVIKTKVKSQQTSPSIGYHQCFFKTKDQMPEVKRTHTSPNLYELINIEMESKVSMTENPMWSSEIIPHCPNKCLHRQTRACRLQHIKNGRSVITSFSVQTITSVNAETFL